MRSVGFVSKTLDKLKYMIFRQELVGIDVSGNKYYRWESMTFVARIMVEVELVEGVKGCPVRQQSLVYSLFH